jgi:hypothetical protein
VIKRCFLRSRSLPCCGPAHDAYPLHLVAAVLLVIVVAAELWGRPLCPALRLPECSVASAALCFVTLPTLRVWLCWFGWCS